MNMLTRLALVVSGLLVAGISHGQTTVSSPAGATSIRDNPGVLGHTFGEIHYSWMDFDDDQNVDPEGFIVGVNGSAPVTRGFDVGFSYNYYRENDHRNPFTGSPFDVRFHQLAASGTLYVPNTGPRPFLTGGVGYQWSRGDIQRLRAYDSEWIWSAGAGIELPLGAFSLTPRVTYTDTLDHDGIGIWRYGGELHHWFNERVGGFVEIAFHDPRDRLRPEAWTYTAGLRFRF